jgi:hypothetical protein
LGLHGRKGLWFRHALPILGEVERIPRICASTELTGEDVNTSPWVAGLFKGTMVRLRSTTANYIVRAWLPRKEGTQ